MKKYLITYIYNIHFTEKAYKSVKKFVMFLMHCTCNFFFLNFTHRKTKESL